MVLSSRFISRLGLWLALGALFPVARLAAHDATPVAASEGLRISAAHAAFIYEGRFDLADKSAPGVVWQGSRIRVDFDGPTLELNFDRVEGQVFFNAEIDGRTTVVALRADQPAQGTRFTDLGAGPHHLVLFKRSEATAGTVRFLGVTIAADAKALRPAAPTYRLAMQFFGDSITVGACNEDGEADQWEDRSTHNNALSYGAMTAAAFGADYRNVAVSGIGMAIGWARTMIFPQIWNRVRPDPASSLADLSDWTPQIVFTNFGENDDSFTRAQNLPFPDQAYIDNYAQLVREIRAAYPQAQIVILRGGMFGGAQSERLRGPWETAVKQIEAADPKVSHYVFKHWSKTHPRVADDRAMADELIAWLKTQPFVRFDG